MKFTTRISMYETPNDKGRLVTGRKDADAVKDVLTDCSDQAVVMPVLNSQDEEIESAFRSQ